MGVKRSTVLKGRFGLEEPYKSGVSQAAELIRFQLNIWLLTYAPQWKLRLCWRW